NNDKSSYSDSLTIVKAEYDKLEDSDVLLAVMYRDDSGVDLEILMFYMMNKPNIGIYTYTRRIAYGNEQKKEAIDILGENQIAYTNLMVIGAIKERGELVDSHEEAIRLLKNLKSNEGL